jgi:hypothetical protein
VIRKFDKNKNLADYHLFEMSARASALSFICNNGSLAVKVIINPKPFLQELTGKPVYVQGLEL